MGFFRYTFATALTGYTRGFQVGRRYPKYQKDFISMGILNLVLLCALFARDPLSAAIVFLIPMLLAYVGTCATTYFHHAGLETDDHLEASHNVLNGPYNVITGNLGYHTAHHMKQGLHWSRLPEYHAAIAADIPAELISYAFPGLNKQAWHNAWTAVRPRKTSVEVSPGCPDRAIQSAEDCLRNSC